MDRLPFEHRFCPYCGAEGTLKEGRMASIDVASDDNEDSVEETLGALEIECTACDTRHFQI